MSRHVISFFRDVGALLRWDRRYQKGALAGVLLGVGGLVSWQLIAGGAAPGGGSAPGQVALKLADAIENGDLLGILDLWVPEERDQYRKSINQIDRSLAWSGVLAPGARLGDLDGVQADVEDLQVRPEPVDPDTWNLHIDARVVLDVETGALVDGGTRQRRRTITVNDEQVTVVRGQDGRWYLSLVATITERLIAERGAANEPILPAGSSTPEQAGRTFLSALAAHDLQALIATLDPESAGHLQRRAGAWVDSVEDDLWSSTWEWSRVELSGGEPDRGRSRIRLDSATLLIDAGTRDAVTFELGADSCYRVRDRLAAETFCAGDVAADAQDAGYTPGMFDALLSSDTRVLELVERGGLWYVDLGKSLAAVAARVIGQAGPGELTELLLG